MLITSFRPSKFFVLLAASCMAWAGILGGAIVYLFGMEIQVGWLVGAAVFILFGLSIAIIAGEMSRAIELREDFENNEWDAELWRTEIASARESLASQSFRGRGLVAGGNEVTPSRRHRRKSRAGSLSTR